MQSEAKTAISAEQLCKAYQIEETKIDVLRNIDLTVQTGQFVAIYGPSGAGKTTLLNMISGIDKPTSGKLSVFGQDLLKQNEDELAE